MSALDQATLVREGHASAAELLDAAIERYEEFNPRINAVNIVWLEHARDLASRIGGTVVSTERNESTSHRPFGGVPTLFKDLGILYAGQRISQGNKAIKAMEYVPQQTSELASRYLQAGMIPFGRTNSCEWGSLPVTEPEAWGPTRNPHDLSRTCGGSSGGAGAAVAAGIVSIAHASDGGGSIRIPASCNGLVGLKPSRGRVSLAPLGDESGLSVQLGVTHTVADTAALLDAVSGAGIGDGVVAPPPKRPFIDEVGAHVETLRIGVLDHDPLGARVDTECRDAARSAAKLLESLGHHVEESYPAAMADASFPPRFGAMWATVQAVTRDSLSQLLGRPATSDDIEAVNWAQAEYASRSSAVDYAKSVAAAAMFRRALAQWWHDGFDVLVTPTLARLPFPVGSFTNDPSDPLKPSRLSSEWVRFTPQFNMSGQPAISLPLARTASGLPIGVQLVAAYGREDILLRVASQLEVAAPWRSHTTTALG